MKKATRESLGERHDPLLPEMVTIPEGEFWMGTDRQRLERAGLEWQRRFLLEIPYHRLYLPPYEIAKYPVTNAQYADFVEATGHRAPVYWEDNRVPSDKGDHPVVFVSWDDVMSYCR